MSTTDPTKENSLSANAQEQQECRPAVSHERHQIPLASLCCRHLHVRHRGVEERANLQVAVESLAPGSLVAALLPAGFFQGQSSRSIRARLFTRCPPRVLITHAHGFAALYGVDAARRIVVLLSLAPLRGYDPRTHTLRRT